MPSEIDAAAPIPTRLAWVDFAAIASGIGVGVGLVRAALATTALDWRLDRDVAVMASLLLIPGGAAWIVFPWLMVRRRTVRRRTVRRRTVRSAESGLWLALALCGLAWSEVFLDGGVRLGAVAKFVGGLSAFFLSPAVGVGSLALAALSLVRRKQAATWSLWLATSFGLTVGAGWIMFLIVMLPLKF